MVEKKTERSGMSVATQEPPQWRRRRRRRRLPPTAKSQVPTATTIHDLVEDLLREIFLRLPSLPSLVRAALTCRAFLAAVRSSPAFRRFRSLHPPPLLGYFFEPIYSGTPLFSLISRPSDPDVAAAVRGAGAPYQEDEFAGWKIEDCRGGYLLLHWSTDQMAIYSPLTRALDLLPTPPEEISSGCRGVFYMKFTLICSTEGLESSFRVVCLCLDKAKSRVRAAVFSSGTREWRLLPWWGTPVAPPSGKRNRLLAGTQANGSIWAHAVQAYMVVLDTKTLQFSWIDLPEHLKGRGYLYKSGETKDGELCIVSVVGFTLHTWFWRADAGGVERWMLHNVLQLEREILKATEGPEDGLAVLRLRLSLRVCAVLDGVVYMSISNLDEPRLPSWFLSFCLETRKVEKLFERTFDRRMFPYFMAWPPRLVCDAV